MSVSTKKKRWKTTPFYVVYDRETGIVMLKMRKFKRGERSRRTKEVEPGWIVDFDAKGSVIQFEVLNPSKHFPKKILALMPPEFEES